MRRIIRMLVFSALALFITLFWNKGIVFHYTTSNTITAIVVISVLFYLVRPLIKLIFLPVNFFTFGIVSFIVNLVLFVFAAHYFHIFEIHPWTFSGFHTGPFVLPKIAINYWLNAVLTSLSISFIINSLETVI